MKSNNEARGAPARPKGRMKRFLAAAMAVLLAACMFPLSAFASSTQYLYSTLSSGLKL